MVVVIDDDNIILDRISNYLNVIKIDSKVFDNPVEFLSFLGCSEMEKVKLCVVDYKMPEMLGDKVAKLVKEKFPSLDIAMYTGNEELDALDEVKQLGIPVIAKGRRGSGSIESYIKVKAKTWA